MLQYLSHQPVEDQRGNSARMFSANVERNLLEDGTENGSTGIEPPGSTHASSLFLGAPERTTKAISRGLG